MNSNDFFGLFFLSIILVMIGWIVFIAQPDAQIKFDKTFDALRFNNDIVMSNPTILEEYKEKYINNSCEITFDRSNFRPNDADLCKNRMHEYYLNQRK